MGKVIDENFNNLIAVNIYNLNSKESLRTDKNGFFETNAEIGDTLRFSFIGLTDEKIVIKDSGFIKLIMIDKSVNCLGAEWSKGDYKKADRQIKKRIKKLYTEAELKEIWNL
jgi:hypothetical protein